MGWPIGRLPEQVYVVQVKIEQLNHWKKVVVLTYHYGPFASLDRAEKEAQTHEPDDEDLIDNEQDRAKGLFVGKTQVDILVSPQVYSVVQTKTF